MAVPEGSDLPPRVGGQADGGEEMTPVVDPLPDSSFTPVEDRLCILLLLTTAVFVPILTIRTLPATMMRNIVLGVSYTLPTTLLVWNADERAHTKWFCGECAVILVCVIHNHLTMTMLPDMLRF
jgi:hypothetical protein